MNHQLIDFYRGQQPDIVGRKIDEIWAFNHESLERVHDYIQWLFPSAKASQFNANAPLLDTETTQLFRSDANLKELLLKSLELMLTFYGLALDTSLGATPTIGKAANYAERQGNWQDAPMPGYLNHNLLRLSRILEALRVLGLENHSTALYNCLAAIQLEEPSKIPAKTLFYWKQSAGIN